MLSTVAFPNKRSTIAVATTGSAKTFPQSPNPRFEVNRLALGACVVALALTWTLTDHSRTGVQPWLGVPAATVHIPRQKFDTPAHAELARHLSMNPWHCLPEHRPLGNQSRARLRMYQELSRLRQAMNQTPHVEPNGNELLE